MRYAVWLVASVIAAPAMAAEINRWPMNDNAASTVVDDPVGADDGTLVGGDNTANITTAGPGGTITAALDFDGTADYVDVTTAAITAGAPSTISVWVKPDSITTAPIFGQLAGGPGYRLRMASATSIDVRGTSASRVFTVPTMTGGTWYHIFITINSGGTECRLWLNGTESSTGALASPGLVQWNQLAANASTYWAGDMAMLRLFDSDESANVATYYAEGVSAGGGPAINPISSSIPGSSLDPIRTTIP